VLPVKTRCQVRISLRVNQTNDRGPAKKLGIVNDFRKGKALYHHLKFCICREVEAIGSVNRFVQCESKNKSSSARYKYLAKQWSERKLSCRIKKKNQQKVFSTLLVTLNKKFIIHVAWFTRTRLTSHLVNDEYTCVWFLPDTDMILSFYHPN